MIQKSIKIVLLAVIAILSIIFVSVAYAAFTKYYPNENPGQNAYNSHQKSSGDGEWYGPKKLPPSGQKYISADYNGEPSTFIRGAMCSTCDGCPIVTKFNSKTDTTTVSVGGN